MKRILALLLSMVLVLSMAACTTAPEQDNKDKVSSENNSKPVDQDANPQPDEPPVDQKPEDDEPEVTYQKLEGKITGASDFNDGYALVCVNGNENTTYCIDKKGNIIFQIGKDFSVSGKIYQKIENGHLSTTKGIYDMTGKLTRPEDVGASQFYDVAFSGGYILVAKVTADYSSTKKEIGVMNFAYEWVVEPSEEIYTAIEKDLSHLTAMNHQSYYYEGYIYFAYSDCYLNVTTGEILETIGQNAPSAEWTYSSKGKFGDIKGNVMLDLTVHDNIKLIYGTKFVNGKAPVMFHNAEARMWFFTLVDEQGNFQFEPVQIPDMPTVGKVCFDGEYLLFADHYLSENHVQCYNAQGEQLGVYKDSYGFSSDLLDGVICIEGRNQCYYYNPDFTPLF